MEITILQSYTLVYTETYKLYSNMESRDPFNNLTEGGDAVSESMRAESRVSLILSSLRTEKRYRVIPSRASLNVVSCVYTLASATLSP